MKDSRNRYEKDGKRMESLLFKQSKICAFTWLFHSGNVTGNWPRHTTPIASKDFPSISMTRHMKRCWRVSVFSTEQTEQRIFLAFPGDFAKLCKNFCHFQFHFAHAHCGTAHLLATPEELCKALRLLRLSQDPQCILGAWNSHWGFSWLILINLHWFHHVPSKAKNFLKNPCDKSNNLDLHFRTCSSCSSWSACPDESWRNSRSF